MGAADPEFCKWQLDYIYQGLEKSKRKRSDIVIDLIVTMSIDEDEQKALSDVRAWATSQAATFDVWKQMPAAWERYRPQFSRRPSSITTRITFRCMPSTKRSSATISCNR